MENIKPDDTETGRRVMRAPVPSAVKEHTVSDVKLAVPTFTALDAAFGAKASTYLTREQMGDEFYAERNRWTKIASSLFFSGGKLADHGLAFKAGIDRAAAMTAIRAWLCSFEPKHEVKIGTVGFALSQWCEDYFAPPTTDHQARKLAAVARKKKGKTKIRRVAA